MSSNNCIFCKIANGDMPSYTIYEDDCFKVFLDLFPASLGHTIVITKAHYENVYALPDDTASRLFTLVKKVALALKKHFDMDGLNILQNNGAASGQTVKHFHIHLIPRSEEDGINIQWGQKSPEETEFNEIRDALSHCLK